MALFLENFVHFLGYIYIFFWRWRMKISLTEENAWRENGFFF